MKYTDTKVVFSEIPDEITLAINLSGCPYACDGCHSPFLREDIGTKLTISVLEKLIKENNGITCVAMMGGDYNWMELNNYGSIVKKRFKLKYAWYSGGTKVPPEIERMNYDYIKIGPYKKELGGLDSKNTNQKLYRVKDGELIDITNKFFR